MRIKASITHQPRNQDWPSLLVQYFDVDSWQPAFKETQKLVNRRVISKGGKLLKVLIEEEQ